MKNYNRFFLTAFAMLVPGLLLTLTAQKKVELRYNVNTGDKYSYNISTDQDISFETNGQTMVMTSKVAFEMTSDILNSDADSIVIRSSIDRVILNQGLFGMQIDYDSDLPESEQNPMAAQIASTFNGMIGKTYSITMDMLGNVKNMDLHEVTKSDDLVKNLSSGSSFANYPEQKVGIGDSWEKDIEPLKTSDMKFHVKYTVLKVSSKQVTLGVKGTVSAKKIENNDMNLRGTQTGEMVVDLKTGWLIKSTIDQELSMNIKQGGQVFPATISGTTVSTSKKID